MANSVELKDCALIRLAGLLVTSDWTFIVLKLHIGLPVSRKTGGVLVAAVAFVFWGLGASLLIESTLLVNGIRPNYRDNWLIHRFRA